MAIMRTGLELISERTSPQQELRGWKLFLLAPRMVLHRTASQARIPPAELALRCEAFARGEWLTLLQAIARTVEAPHPVAARSAAHDIEARAHRAAALVHLGELSAAGHALTAEPLAPATDATLAELRDPMRRPPGPFTSEVTSSSPKSHARSAFLAGLRKARRGAAAGPSGPSGATNERLRILLDDEVDSQLLHCAAQRLAQADVPASALAAIRVGRIDLQATWLLLHYCAGPRANYLLRSLPPATTAAYYFDVRRSRRLRLTALVGLADAPLPPQPARAARLALRFGGLGLRAASRSRYRPSRSLLGFLDGHSAGHPNPSALSCEAQRLLTALRDDRAARLPSLLAATQAAAYLTTQGYAVPSWDEAISNVPGPHSRMTSLSISCADGSAEPPTPAMSAHSRRTLLTCPLRPERCCSRKLVLTRPEPSRYCPRPSRLARAAAPAAACSMRTETIELHAPHPASGVLASRALPLERAIARVCLEAGARVGRSVALAAMNIDVRSTMCGASRSSATACRYGTCRGRHARQPGDPRWPPT
eukprot:s5894_g4.t1